MSKLSRFKEDTEDQILETLKLLQQELALKTGAAFDLKKFCTAPNKIFYEKQYNSIVDPWPFTTDVTTRRSGKTTGKVGAHIDTALKYPRSSSLYITTTRLNAKKIMFPVLCNVVRDYNLPATPNIADLSMTFSNGSNIYLAGVNDSQSIHNFRGMKLKRCTVDEAQSMRSYIEQLIDDVIAPALVDENGVLGVTGTPGAVPTGYFHKIAHSNHWHHHFYSIFDNPFIENARQRLEIELQRRGVSIDHPSIQREWFGRWEVDTDALVIKYDEARDHYDDLPTGIEWEYVVIADFGYDDADAIATLAFSQKHPTAYLVEEKITTKQGITPLAEQLIEHIARYKPMKVIGDFGALGKKIAVELQTRFGIPIEAAEKSRKIEYIELLNDSLRTGRFKAKKTSRFAEDSKLLEWDMDYQEKHPESMKVSDRYHSDIVDCAIYGHRELLHWLWKAPERVPEIGSLEDLKRQEDEVWQRIRDQQNKSKEESAFWSDPFDYEGQ